MFNFVCYTLNTNQFESPMKLLFSVSVLALALISCNGTGTTQTEENQVQETPKLNLVWKTDTTFTGSESSLYDASSERIYVSSGNTVSGDKDNDGFISILQTDGTVTELKWVADGLHAPKGMALLDGKLYVSDIDELKVIDIASAKVEQVIPVQGAVFLNDVATDGSQIYVSDTRAGTIYAFTPNGDYSLIVENSPSVNGLECFEGHLYVLDGEGLKKFSNDGNYTPENLYPEMTGGDGLVIINDSTFIASRWHGEIFMIRGSEMTTLLDTREEKSNTADIGFVKGKNLVLVPTFLKNEVAAYELNY